MELKAKYEQRIEQAEAELRQVKNKILRTLMTCLKFHLLCCITLIIS